MVLKKNFRNSAAAEQSATPVRVMHLFRHGAHNVGTCQAAIHMPNKLCQAAIAAGFRSFVITYVVHDL
jgi:hypothetical protein